MRRKTKCEYCHGEGGYIVKKGLGMIETYADCYNCNGHGYTVNSARRMLKEYFSSYGTKALDGMNFDWLPESLDEVMIRKIKKHLEEGEDFTEAVISASSELRSVC